MTIATKFEACILAGAIGDAIGSQHESTVPDDPHTLYPFGKPPLAQSGWRITDDTQLTLATIEAWNECTTFSAPAIAEAMTDVYATKRLIGAGASTIKALQELQVGGDWSQVGRRGEFAAGNGAAMRIAPLAFDPRIGDADIRDICFITHRNDEAYIGAKCVVLMIREAVHGKLLSTEVAMKSLASKLPDTNVRDRILQLATMTSIADAAALGCSGYVVDSVPLAIYAALTVGMVDLRGMYTQLIEVGGDTDTNCSIAGQIVGAARGVQSIPTSLKTQLMKLPEYAEITSSIQRFRVNPPWS